MNDVKYIVKHYLDYQCPKMATIPWFDIGDSKFKCCTCWNRQKIIVIGDIGHYDSEINRNRNLFIVVWVSENQSEIGVIHPRLRLTGDSIKNGQDKMLEDRLVS